MKTFCEDLFFFFFFGDRLKNFCEDLFFFWRALALCVLGPWPWPRAFLSLASRVSVLGKAVLALASDFFCVLGLGLEPCVLDSTSDIFLGRRYIHLLQVNKIFIKMLLRQRCLSKKYWNAFPRQKKVSKRHFHAFHRTVSLPLRLHLLSVACLMFNYG